MNYLKFSVVGVGPGDPELITIKAIRVIKEADVVLVPYSAHGKFSVAERIVRSNIPDIVTIPIMFPMITDGDEREKFLLSALEKIPALRSKAVRAALPVIGDSVIYSTGFYLFGALQKLAPDVELSLVPGISAHQLGASTIGAFLAMGDEVFSVIPCSKNYGGIAAALRKADSAALYKLNMLKDRISYAVEETGPWQHIVRIDRAGMADEMICEGKAALEPTEEYLSILLLWRKYEGRR